MRASMMSRSGRIVLVGCGGHARSIVDTLLHNDPSVDLIFWDSNAQPNEMILGFPVLKTVDHRQSDRYAIGIGDNGDRRQRFSVLDREVLLTVVSSLSHVGANAVLGCGCFVSHMVSIGPEVCVGDNSIINTGSVVEHEVTVGSHCHIAPNTTICGRSVIGDSVLVGAGSTILDGVHVCDDVVIGAGAVVCANIATPGTYVGCPVRRLERPE